MQPTDSRQEWLARRAAELVRTRLALEESVNRAKALDRDLSLAARQTAEARSKVAELEQNIADLKASLSWRLTQPVRWIGDKLHNPSPIAIQIPGPSLTACTPENSQPDPVPSLVPCGFDPPPLALHPRRIGVDVSSLCESDSRGGIQRVVRQIANHLVALDPDEIVLLDLRPGWPADVTWKFVENETTLARANQPCLELKTIFLLDASWRFVRVIGPLMTAARRAGIEVVGCVYDLIPVDHPETCLPQTREAYVGWLAAAVGWCDRFVCISESVARRLQEHLAGVPEKPCRAVGWWPLGCDFVELSESPAAPPVAGAYALMVGTLEPRKGHASALDAFEKGWASGELTASLVVAGRPGWGTEDFVARMTSHPEWKKTLFWFDGPDDQTLTALYQNASVILQPSTAEGFGLPVVEGGRFGKPIVMSDLPVFRELVVKDGYFFPAGDQDGLGAALQRALELGVRATKVVATSWNTSSAKLLSWLRETDSQIVLSPRATTDSECGTDHPTP